MNLNLKTLISILLVCIAFGACDKQDEPKSDIIYSSAPHGLFNLIESGDGKTEVTHPDFCSPYYVSVPPEGGIFRFKLGENAYCTKKIIGDPSTDDSFGYITSHKFLLINYEVHEIDDEGIWLNLIDRCKDRSIKYKYQHSFFHCTFDRFQQSDSFTIDIEPNDTGKRLEFYLYFNGLKSTVRLYFTPDFWPSSLCILQDSLPTKE